MLQVTGFPEGAMSAAVLQISHVALLALASIQPRATLTAASTRRSVISASAAPREVIVVGGGWAGFTAAESVSASQRDVRVTLLDASPSAGGLAGGWRTPSGRPVEAGIHGFWREYRNTFAMIDAIGLDRDEVLTPYTPSVLASKTGRVATAPVLLEQSDAMRPVDRTAQPVLRQLASLLPPPLDTAILADFDRSSPLSAADRVSAIGLLACWADFKQEERQSWLRYDRLSAEELFLSYGGVTRALYDELVSPLLHVLPMAPGYDVSAAAALSCFHAFALQSRGAFDVRWCRGAIAERIFAPWRARLEARGNVAIRGGARVASIRKGGDGRLEVDVQSRGAEACETLRADAVVLAVGGVAASKLAQASPLLGSLHATRGFERLRGITCVAVRMYLRPAAAPTGGLRGGAHPSTMLPPPVAKAMEASPVLVCGPGVGSIPQLAETGFCVYDLQRLHDEIAADREVAALEVDFFRADDLAEISDDRDLAELALRAATAALGLRDGALDASMLVDVAVVRARRAVSHFAVGSASVSPGVRLGDGVFACGDWIDRCGHASWSTEKAVVTGKQAAAAVGAHLGLDAVDADVLPAAPDTPTLSALRQLATAARAIGSTGRGAGLPPPAPWAPSSQSQRPGSRRR